MSIPETRLVSVVVEGYNERILGTSVSDVLGSLADQQYPLDRVEVILVGCEDDYSARHLTTARSPFHRVVILDAKGSYYDLKNRGVEQASGTVIAFCDSDVHPQPHWLASIVAAIEGGAHATVGLSMYYNRGTRQLPQAVLDVAGSISWGFVVGLGRPGDLTDAGGIVSHNLAMRREVARVHPFSTELGRNCGSPLMHGALTKAGCQVRFSRYQVVEHSFSLGWFFYPLHARLGWEEFMFLQLDAKTGNQGFSSVSFREPLITMLGRVWFDLRRWFTYGRLLGLKGRQIWVRLPLLLVLSSLARAAGALGKYAAILSPRRSREWAERQ